MGLSSAALRERYLGCLAPGLVPADAGPRARPGAAVDVPTARIVGIAQSPSSTAGSAPAGALARDRVAGLKASALGGGAFRIVEAGAARRLGTRHTAVANTAARATV